MENSILNGLKKGDKFYKIVGYEVTQFIYHEPLPSHSDYHIVLKNGAFPERIYKNEFNNVFLNMMDAKQNLIETLEYHISLLKS